VQNTIHGVTNERHIQSESEEFGLAGHILKFLCVSRNFFKTRYRKFHWTISKTH